MEELSELLTIRRDKLAKLRALGVNPFGQRYDTTHTVAEVCIAFIAQTPETPGLQVRIAGRLTAHRDMGKSHFLDLSSAGERIQLYVSTKELGPELTEIFKLLDLGDFIGVEGFCFLTRTGEKSVHVKNFTVLAKSLRPLPEKWHGVTDVETKYRQRYLDLVANLESREVFLKRIKIVAGIRDFLQKRGFLEVETPMMQSIAGGAAAQPFKTHHNAMGVDLFLRIAPELYLKRLLVGGFDKVFELNRNFRNEGVSRRHNPEFTMLEAYWAYADFEIMADMMESLICHLAETVCGTLIIDHKNSEGEITKTIDLTRPWKRARYNELITEKDPTWLTLNTEQKRNRAHDLGFEVSPQMQDFEMTQQFFEKLIEEKSINPLFVTHVPSQLAPLAKQNVEDGSVVDVFELVINGQEIAPGYSELNDPIVQRARLEEQAGEEVQSIDEEILLALEHGMPPAGGIGLGIDRLVMMLTGAESIRDVIFFPHLKTRN